MCYLINPNVTITSDWKENARHDKMFSSTGLSTCREQCLNITSVSEAIPGWNGFAKKMVDRNET